MNHDVTNEALRLSPPVTIAGLSLAGISLQDWVLIVTLIYTAASLFFLLRDKLYRPWRERNARK